MKGSIQLICENLIKNPPAYAEAEYEINGDTAVFSVKTSLDSQRQFAVVFYGTEKEYTAAVERGGKNCVFNVPLFKIAFAEGVKVLDIDDERVFLDAEFKIKDESKPQIPMPSEFDIPNDLEISATEDAAAAKIIEDIFSDELFFEEENVCNFSSKSLFESVYKKFELFELPNHNLYIFDDENPLNSSVRINFAGGKASAQSLFLGYSNFIKDVSFPEKILGEAFDGSGAEYNVFGILGRNVTEDQPFGGATGYLFFHRIPSSEYGYWLMYLNAITGALCLPSGSSSQKLF